MGRVRRLAFVLVLALQLPLLAGCGYRLAAAPPALTQPMTAAVPVFRNLTYHAAGEGIFTEAVVQNLLRHGIKIQDPANAEYVIYGEIISFANTGVAYSATDTAVLYKAEVEVEITVKNRQQEVKLRERIRRRVENPAQTRRAFQLNVDTAAVEDLAGQVAQTVLLRLLDLQGSERRP